MATLGVTILVVKSELVDLKTVHAVDADSLDRGVLDVKVVDLGVGKLVSSEELGLRNATVSTLAIPVLLTTGVENSTRSLNGNLVSRDLHERTLPLLVAPGRGSLEDDLGVVLELAEIKSHTAGDGDTVEDNGGARSLGLAGLGSTIGTGEGAAGSTLAVGVDFGSLSNGRS